MMPRYNAVFVERKTFLIRYIPDLLHKIPLTFEGPYLGKQITFAYFEWFVLIFDNVECNI